MSGVLRGVRAGEECPEVELHQDVTVLDAAAQISHRKFKAIGGRYSLVVLIKHMIFVQKSKSLFM